MILGNSEQHHLALLLWFDAFNLAELGATDDAGHWRKMTSIELDWINEDVRWNLRGWKESWDVVCDEAVEGSAASLSANVNALACTANFLCS